jgi:hypothetical protein
MIFQIYGKLAETFGTQTLLLAEGPKKCRQHHAKGPHPQRSPQLRNFALLLTTFTIPN